MRNASFLALTLLGLCAGCNNGAAQPKTETPRAPASEIAAPLPIQSGQIRVTEKVLGQTPFYLGINPGGPGGYADGSSWGQADDYGTIAFWIAQSGANAARAWGSAEGNEGVQDSPTNSNDTVPDGDGVSSPETFAAARAAVIADPLNNKFINWEKFDAVSVWEAAERDRPLGLEILPVLRHKHGGRDDFPSFMGGRGVPIDERDPGLQAWPHQWEWWEHCFAMSYLWAKNTGVTRFEIGNEPEFGRQGGLTIEEQLRVTRIAIDGIRAGAKAAGKTAWIMAPATNKEDYVVANVKALGDQLDAISVHSYEPDNVKHLGKMIDAAAGKPTFNSEHGANAERAPQGLAAILFEYLKMGARGLNGVLVFKFTGGGNNGLVLPTDQTGLFQPRAGYFGMRMLFRAGVGAKSLLETQSADPQIETLATRDANHAFVTVWNKGDAAKNSVLTLPSWPGQLQSVWIFDGEKWLDAPWDGATQKAGQIEIVNQPAGSWVQLVWGEKPLAVTPAPFDATRFTQPQLSQPFLSFEAGGNVASFADDFNDKNWQRAKSSDWVTRGYQDGGTAAAQGLVRDGRLYLRGWDWDFKKSLVMLWAHKTLAFSDQSPAIFEARLGYDDAQRGTDPKLGAMFHDQSGALLGLSGFPNRAHGRFQLVGASSAATPEALFGDAATLLSGSKTSAAPSGRVKWIIGKTKVRFQILDSAGAVLSDSGTIAHKLDLSGEGRFGLLRQGKNPVWFDDLSFLRGDGYDWNAPVFDAKK